MEAAEHDCPIGIHRIEDAIGKAPEERAADPAVHLGESLGMGVDRRDDCFERDQEVIAEGDASSAIPGVGLR